MITVQAAPSAPTGPISLAVGVSSTETSSSNVPLMLSTAPVLSNAGFTLPIPAAPMPLPTAVVDLGASGQPADLFTFSHPAESSSGGVFLPSIPEDDSWTTMTDASRAAYRTEIQQFMVPLEGEQPSQVCLRERIGEAWKVLSVVEDMYLACKGKPLYSEEGLRMDYASSFLWLHRLQAKSLVKLMIAKRSGWKVLQDYQAQVLSLIHI